MRSAAGYRVYSGLSRGAKVTYEKRIRGGELRMGKKQVLKAFRVIERRVRGVLVSSSHPRGGAQRHTGVPTSTTSRGGAGSDAWLTEAVHETVVGLCLLQPVLGVGVPGGCWLGRCRGQRERSWCRLLGGYISFGGTVSISKYNQEGFVLLTLYDIQKGGVAPMVRLMYRCDSHGGWKKQRFA